MNFRAAYTPTHVKRVKNHPHIGSGRMVERVEFI